VNQSPATDPDSGAVVESEGHFATALASLRGGVEWIKGWARSTWQKNWGLPVMLLVLGGSVYLASMEKESWDKLANRQFSVALGVSAVLIVLRTGVGMSHFAPPPTGQVIIVVTAMYAVAVAWFSLVSGLVAESADATKMFGELALVLAGWAGAYDGLQKLSDTDRPPQPGSSKGDGLGKLEAKDDAAQRGADERPDVTVAIGGASEG
jgi:hypothetical protein